MGGGWTLGDLLPMEYNLWFENCDGAYCDLDLVGDLLFHALLPTNLFGQDPLLARSPYFPPWNSPCVDAGDPSVLDVDGSNSDVGAYGGPGADTLDGDGDGVMNIYDCDDDDAARSPLVLEVCDGQDNDCDGEADQGFDILWYPDVDGDEHGDAEADPEQSCVPVPTKVLSNDDCDDSDAQVSPSAGERCNDSDDDCNGIIDDEDQLTFANWGFDSDGDLAVDEESLVKACDAPDVQWYILEDSSKADCDDTDPLIFPDAPELCDDIDQNCDEDPYAGAIDEVEYWTDLDGDGFGVELVDVGCVEPEEGGPFAAAGEDCDDLDVDVNPEMEEVCNQLDDNCDDEIDNVPPGVGPAWYVDNDGDGVGDARTARFGCEQPDALHGNQFPGDCDDDDPDVGICEPISCDGCQATATPLSTSLAALFGVLLVGMRRRR
jgi:hypothetical protein